MLGTGNQENVKCQPDRAEIGKALFIQLELLMGTAEARDFLNEELLVINDAPDPAATYLLACARHQMPYRTVRRVALKSGLATAETIDRKLRQLKAAGRLRTIPIYPKSRGNPLRLVISDKTPDVLQTKQQLEKTPEVRQT